MSELLEVRDLRINFYTYRGIVKALEGVHFSMAKGEAVGLVGETGCGKSVTARAIMGFVEPPGKIESGEILLEGENLLSFNERAMKAVRGRKISFIFQEPKKALDPTATVGDQLLEAAATARGLRRRDGRTLAIETLRQVGLGDPARVMASYSFELSGGMAQRVMIGMGMVGGSRLMIADEPTSALDVSIQAQILALLREIRARQESALLLITHDLAVAAENCDRIIVMYAGRIVESGPVEEIFRHPSHPYTVKLLNALPARGRSRLEAIPGSVPDLVDPPKGCRFSNRCDRATEKCQLLPPLVDVGPGHAVACFHPVGETLTVSEETAAPAEAPVRAPAVAAAGTDGPIIEARGLTKRFSARGGSQLPWEKAAEVRAVDGIDFAIRSDEIFGLAGESGCGKSTVARLLMGLIDTSDGELLFRGKPIASYAPSEIRPRVQMVFQDPYTSLNPRRTVGAIVGEPLIIHTKMRTAERRQRVMETLERVGLAGYHYERYPHEFSGGQRQRIAIARALILNPEFLVLDEPTSALDVSVQAVILNMILELQAELHLGCLFITHDLNLMRFLAHRVGVMYLGRIVEVGATEAIFSEPLHPYTEALIAATPQPDPTRKADKAPLQGEIPSNINRPPGCAFASRCPKKIDGVCETIDPALLPVGDRLVACHLHNPPVPA